MGLLTQILVGLAGAASEGHGYGPGRRPQSCVDGVLARTGGLAGLLDQFARKGYGVQASSRVSTGANPIHCRVADVFDDEHLSAIAQEAGVSTEEARAGFRNCSPKVVDDLALGTTAGA